MRKVLVVIGVLFSYVVNAQEMSSSVKAAIESDDSTTLKTYISSSNVSDCYGHYSVLSHAVRFGAIRCVKFLLDLGADPNQACKDYIPSLMHAAKYGRIEVAKLLLKKGADINFRYGGSIEELKGMTALDYAEKFQQTEFAEFLRNPETKN